MDFPHLSDNGFPYASNVNVYQFQNTFDYTRWSEKTRIKLCNVLWNSSYADVVKWDTDVLRDSYFDSLTDTWTTELMSAARIVPEGFIKLPIPYDVMARYNYLYIDMPVATGVGNLIDYEKTGGIKRWYFFVQDINYLSPNATQVVVVPDVWTNFQNKIFIPYMMLERGHAPVAYSDTDTYLTNPIANNRLLLAPDVNFDNAGITRSSSYVPFGNGTKYVCFASTCAPSQLASLGLVSVDSTYNPSQTITYSDVNARYGYQLQVNGYGVGNGYDYSDANTPVSVGYSNGSIANNLTVYAIAASSVYGNNATWFSDIITYCPQFLNTIKACFVVDENCLTFDASYTIYGYTLYECSGKSQSLLSKTLAKADFSYPSELQRFAKLYTSPYAQIEITDNDGKTVEVNIEETGTLNVYSAVSIAFPYINERVFVDGIGGVGSKSYAWLDLKDVSHSCEMSNSDWFKYCFDWNIPTFALYMDGQTAFMLESFNRNVAQARHQSLVDYHCSMRSANTAYENACDQADTAYTNTERNAYTAAANAHRSANTGKTNADNSADTNRAVSYNANNNSVTNSSVAAYYYLANENLAIANSEELMYNNNRIQIHSSTLANTYINNSTSSNVNMKSTNAVATQIGQIASGALSGGLSGATSAAVGGPFTATTGAVFGAAGGAIQAAVTQVQLSATTNNDTSQAGNQTQLNTDMALDLSYYNEWSQLGNATYNMRGISAYKTDSANNTYQSAMAQINNTSTTNITNMDALQLTAKTNATNTKNTSISNADDTYVVVEACAGRTQTNVKANASYTRQVAELNSKEILENGRYINLAAIADSRNSRPIELCPNSGNPAADFYRTRGLQIKVKTQSDSAIRQTGDIFARFGYALNQIWDVATSGLKLMNHFTYWKASEIWVNGGEASNNAINTFIRDMFLKGVTVWNNPNEIGGVNVYTN